MHEKVAAYLEKKQQEENDRTQTARSARLLELGLYDTVFPPEGADAAEYPDFEDGKRCRRVPVEVSDQEYEAICLAAEADSPALAEKKSRAGIVAAVLFWIGVIACAMGVILMMYAFGMGGGLLAGLSSLLIYAVIGSVLLGLSEIVRALGILSQNTQRDS